MRLVQYLERCTWSLSSLAPNLSVALLFSNHADFHYTYGILWGGVLCYRNVLGLLRMPKLDYSSMRFPMDSGVKAHVRD